MVTVSQLWQYPFKSGKGVSLQTARFDEEGLCGDRRLVALDKNGLFITARKYPQLLQLSCTQVSDGWLLKHPQVSNDCFISANSMNSATIVAGKLWRDELQAIDGGHEASAWLSAALGITVTIALWQKHARVSGKYQLETNFSDAAPLLITTEASLLAASTFANIAPDMRRFRPNIVLSGCDAFAEEGWQQLKIGQVTFTLLDTCVRCILTTRDPETGTAHPDKQPLRALKQYHTNEQKQPIFGVNAKLLMPIISNAEITIGDEVTLD
ncbi:MOSC domain-containing protein [Colwellia asteriadis]|uniref:MOSC domain-containing protein n=1 Tax=Colwellia asteriadis TaxID=517723 RepID=A0ABP3WIG0_9GAMM